MAETSPGLLRGLYMVIADNYRDPQSEMGIIVGRARDDGLISDDLETVIQHRTSLDGYDFLTLVQLGEALGEESYSKVRETELKAYKILLGYLPWSLRDLAENSRTRRDMPVNGNSPVLTVMEVAGLLHIHVNTVRRWCDLGVLNSFRVGPRKDRRIRKEDIEKIRSGTLR